MNELSGTTSPKTTPLPSSSLSTPVQYIKGVGPHRAELLKKLGLFTLKDMLFHFPRTHQDRRRVLIKDLEVGRKVTIIGELGNPEYRQVGKMLGQARVALHDSSGSISAIWFKRVSFKYDVFSTLKRLLQEGQTVLCFGTAMEGRNGVEFRVEDCELVAVSDDLGPVIQQIVPMYPLTEGIQDRWLRDILQNVVWQHAQDLLDPLPKIIQEQQKLMPFAEALKLYHRPANMTELGKARERLAFDEFFYLELALAVNRQNREHHFKGNVFTPRKNLLTPFKKHLGYEFTKAQVKTINEIFKDMGRSTPMNRLLQGDVGSGKTVVALSAALLAIENDKQAVFVAPTEILAVQHMLSIQKLLDGLPVRSALLTGSTPKPERKKILEDLASGKISLLIGTHAILEETVAFQNLGLAIIDEQHRFGVRQRAQLVSKNPQAGLLNNYPDILIMTATPIPRTLALTLYGDLDLSIIDEMPAGRNPIRTRFAFENEAVQKAHQAIQKGEQVYIVFPLVEESDLLGKKTGKTIRAAKKEFDLFQAKFPAGKTALLHGQMKGDEKRIVMDQFRSGRVSVLVATPVIEVGIDVPNATLMIIINPERFGLAQLHQLRGRVGRSALASECLLVTDDPAVLNNERLLSFCNILDGFRLAEEDLRLRGPGEFLGEAQHGLPFFRVGDLIHDGLLISQAREAAKGLVHGEVALTMKEFGNLNMALKEKFGPKLQLSNIG